MYQHSLYRSPEPDRSPFRSWTVALIALLGTVGCGSIFGVGNPCNRGPGLEVCIDREEYPPGSNVRLTLTNVGNESLLVDVCSIQISSSVHGTDQIDFRYHPPRRCGFDVTPEQQLEMAIALGPGSNETRDLPIFSGAPQSFTRVGVWLLDPEGMPLSETPVSSPVFRIVRSAAE